MPHPSRVATATASVVALLILSAGCGDSDDDAASQTPSPSPVSTAEPTASAEPSADATSAASPRESAVADTIQTIEIDVVNGKPTEKIGTITVKRGEKLTFVVTSDADHEVHIHAGDISFELPAGETVTKTVTINAAAGSYEVELEDTGTLLFTLAVR